MRGNAFKRYVFSYLSMALTICLTLGLTLNLVATRQLVQTEMDIYRGRLAQAGDYIERQLAAIEDILLDIKTQLAFQPFHLKQDATKSIDLLEALSRYSSYSSWMDEYYLWYRTDERVFSPNGTYTEEVFFNYIMNGMEDTSLESALAPTDKIYFQVADNRPDALMICLPFYFGTNKLRTEECALIVMVRLNYLRRTIWEITGTEPGASFSLRYNGIDMFGSADDDAMLHNLGTAGHVEVLMPSESFSSMGRLAAFERMTLYIIIAAVLIGAALAVYSAWRSYQPIRTLYGKYISSEHSPSNELKTIEELLSSTLQINAFSQKKMESQMTQLTHQQNWLKQQLVMMIISGNDSPVVRKQIQATGFGMVHSRFAICFLHLCKGNNTEGILRDIEDFSDEECALYAAELQENREYAILMNFDDVQRCQDNLELLSDMLSVRNLTAHLQMSHDVSQLGAIASASIDALNAPVIPIPDHSDVDSGEKNNLECLKAAIEEGDARHAQLLLDAIITHMEHCYPSYLMRIYMLNRLNQELTMMAWRAGVELSAKMPQLKQDLSESRQYLSELVAAMCDKSQAEFVPFSTDIPNQDGKVEAYIRQHYMDGNICLSSTADALGISTKQVARLLRSGVDMTFKEYLLRLRMETAQRILREENLTIAETAERVGYFNISHFIKCFKSYFGLTPGEWRRRMAQRD